MADGGRSFYSSAHTDLYRGPECTVAWSCRVRQSPSSGPTGGLTDTDTAPQSTQRSTKLALSSIPPISLVPVCVLYIYMCACVFILYSVSSLKQTASCGGNVCLQPRRIVWSCGWGWSRLWIGSQPRELLTKHMRTYTHTHTHTCTNTHYIERDKWLMGL